MRYLATFLLCFVLACGAQRAEWKLPAEIEGGYKLSVGMPSKEVFDMIGKTQPRASQTAVYDGPGKFSAAVFEYAPGVAFEMHQKWRSVPNKIAFSRGVYFVVLESDSMNAAELSKIATALEKAIPAN